MIERESGAIDREATAPPPMLLSRILAAAENQPRASGSFNGPLPRLALVWGVAVSLAVALVAVWSVSLRASLEQARSTQNSQANALSLLATEGTRRYLLLGADGVVAVAETDARCCS